MRSARIGRGLAVPLGTPCALLWGLLAPRGGVTKIGVRPGVGTGLGSVLGLDFVICFEMLTTFRHRLRHMLRLKGAQVGSVMTTLDALRLEASCAYNYASGRGIRALESK